jgi:hypothetical protein
MGLLTFLLPVLTIAVVIHDHVEQVPRMEREQ